MFLRVFALVLALAAVALVAACGPGTRFGLWPYQVGFVLLRSAVYAGLGATAVAVVARVAAAGRGSRIDVRSKSRLGRSDIGTNARRIRAYLERLK